MFERYMWCESLQYAFWEPYRHKSGHVVMYALLDYLNDNFIRYVGKGKKMKILIMLRLWSKCGPMNLKLNLHVNSNLWMNVLHLIATTQSWSRKKMFVTKLSFKKALYQKCYISCLYPIHLMAGIWNEPTFIFAIFCHTG